MVSVQQGDRLSVLASIEHLIDALLTSEDVDAVMRTASVCLTHIADVDASGIAALDDQGTNHRILRDRETTPTPLPTGAPVSFVAHSGEMLHYSLDDIPPAPEGYDAEAWEASHEGLHDIHHVILIPLLSGDVSQGAMWLISRKDDCFHPWFVEQSRALAAIIAMALERAHKSERAREQVENIRQTNEVLAASNREFEDFAQMASSDLQNPLRKIIGFGERLEKSGVERLTDRERDYLTRIHSASDRMQDLINDLLQFSCVHSEDAPQEKVDLTLVLADVLCDLELALAESGGQLKIGDLPTVVGNPTQLRQVFQNLVGNAIKFAVEGRPPIIAVQSKMATSTDCVIEVVDNGIGFDMAFHDRIFKPFQRLNGAREYRGSGIGLSICRRIVERHGGDITASSVLGEGATFSITLAAGGQV